MSLQDPPKRLIGLFALAPSRISMEVQSADKAQGAEDRTTVADHPLTGAKCQSQMCNSISSQHTHCSVLWIMLHLMNAALCQGCVSVREPGRCEVSSSHGGDRRS